MSQNGRDTSLALHNGSIPVLGRNHDWDGPHSAEVGASHAAEVGASHSAGRGNGGVARWPVVFFRGYLVVLRFGVLMEVGRRHGAQRGTLATHAGEAACGRNAALGRGYILSVGEKKKDCVQVLRKVFEKRFHRVKKHKSKTLWDCRKENQI